MAPAGQAPAHPPNQLDCRPFQVGQSDLEFGTGQTRVRRRLLFGLMEKRRRVKHEKAFEERLAEEARRLEWRLGNCHRVGL